MKIAIAGYGVEGEENYAYWSSHARSDDTITIVDEREQLPNVPKDVATQLGAGAFERLEGFDLVIRTAGLAPRKIKTNGKIWSATNEFFEKCPVPIIGVTGSKGKGTTSSLIASLLEAAGKKVWLVGNIGKPALSVLNEIQPGDVVVYELSSFQLWDSERSPQTAVVLFIEQEHLDVHLDMQEYVGAKANIVRFQAASDRLTYDADNSYSTEIAELSKAYKVAYHEYSSSDVEASNEESEGAYIKGDFFYYRFHETVYTLCNVDALKLPGMHNKTNALAALNACWPQLYEAAQAQAGETETLEECLVHFTADGFSHFTGLPHRLSYVATVDGVRYYDDSIATTPGSAVVALKAFAGHNKVIILGGSYKGSNYTEVASLLKQPDYAAHTLLIGAEAPRIAQVLADNGVHTYEHITGETGAEVMQRVVERAQTLLQQSGGVVLLSPAAASFGLFTNYVDRGEKFISAVKSLSHRL